MTSIIGVGALSARILSGAALVAGTVLGGSALAAADITLSAPPGDNGTVKIHDPNTPEDDNRNVPKVCEFQVTAFGFDPAQEVSWQILNQGGRPGNREVFLEDTLVLDEEGAGSTDFLELEDGHYRLEWTFEGQNSNSEKHKVFKVRCEADEEDPEESPSPEEPSGEEPEVPGEEPETPETPETPDTSETPEVSETDGPTDPAETGGPANEADEAAAPGTSGGLPVTGSALAGLVAAGAVALVGGGAAVYFGRRRRGASAEDGPSTEG